MNLCLNKKSREQARLINEKKGVFYQVYGQNGSW